MPALLIMGLAAVAGIGSGWYVTGKGLDDPNLEPKLLGMDAGWTLGIGGLALAALVGGPVGLVGLGVAVGSMVASHGVKKTKEGLQEMVKSQVQAALPGGGGVVQPPAPPALPGPTAPLPPVDPASAPGANLLDLVLPPPEAPA